MASTLHHRRSPTTSALVNFLLMACPRAVLAEEVAPTHHQPCLTQRPFQGPTVSTLSLSPQAVLALKPRHTNAGRVEATRIQMMMMMNSPLDPQLLEVVTLFPVIRKKFHFYVQPFLYNSYLGAVKPFASSASNQSNDDVTSSGKVMHVSRKPSLRRTRKPVKCISLIEVCLPSPHSIAFLIDRFSHSHQPYQVPRGCKRSIRSTT